MVEEWRKDSVLLFSLSLIARNHAMLLISAIAHA
jgi:hypothetical protein